MAVSQNGYPANDVTLTDVFTVPGTAVRLRLRKGADVLAPRYFNGRKMTIYGGSSEVQRGIMSKVMLGL